MTVDEALRAAAARLARAGVREPQRDAELLLQHLRGWSAADVFTRGRDRLPGEVAADYEALVGRRAQRVPLQHITGGQAFWRHQFEVSAGALIPRPETEGVVEQALELLRGLEAPRVADLGTGSGCIALSIAAERPDAQVTAIDISPPALRVAARNAARLALTTRVPLVRGDLAACLRASTLDLVVSNPPYVEEEKDWPRLAPEVRDHEPQVALVPPAGVAALYGRLLADAARVLRLGGHAVVEIGQGQEQRVVAAGRAAGLVHLKSAPDLQGIPRVLVFTRD